MNLDNLQHKCQQVTNVDKWSKNTPKEQVMGQA
jgi:hypothetical protein